MRLSGFDLVYPSSVVGLEFKKRSSSYATEKQFPKTSILDGEFEGVVGNHQFTSTSSTFKQHHQLTLNSLPNRLLRDLQNWLVREFGHWSKGNRTKNQLHLRDFTEFVDKISKSNIDFQFHAHPHPVSDTSELKANGRENANDEAHVEP